MQKLYCQKATAILTAPACATAIAAEHQSGARRSARFGLRRTGPRVSLRDRRGANGPRNPRQRTHQRQRRCRRATAEPTMGRCLNKTVPSCLLCAKAGSEADAVPSASAAIAMVIAERIVCSLPPCRYGILPARPARSRSRRVTPRARQGSICGYTAKYRD
jgi:hypothetical protein